MKIEDTSIERALCSLSLKGVQYLSDWWTTFGFDDSRNRFYGEVYNDNTPNPASSLMVIQRARILWFFSTISQLEKFSDYKIYADIQYKELITYFHDKTFGGFIWEVNKDYTIINNRKQTYAQAFCIYALSEYYLLSKDEDAKSLALETFDLLEKKTWDSKNDGYIEAMDHRWSHMSDMRLSPKDKNEPKTMNTHLHILEAYTTLCKISYTEEVTKSLVRVLGLYSDRFHNKNNNHFHLFFDNEWNLKSNIISYGHDIESSWLMHEAAEMSNDLALQSKMNTLVLSIANNILDNGLSVDGGVKNEIHDSIADATFDWWPQAEAVIGFINAYQISGEIKFIDASNKCLKFIQNYFIGANNDEWYWKITEDLKPVDDISKSNGWKAPYHNGRMYVEILARFENSSSYTNDKSKEYS